MLALAALSLQCTICGCGGARLEPPGSRHSTISPSASPPPLDGSALPSVDPARRALAEPIATPLEISGVLPVWGDDSALFVSQFSGQRCGFVQRVFGAKPELGPILEVCDELVFSAFARGDELSLASTQAGNICITRYRGAEVAGRACEASWGTTLTALADGYVILGPKPFDPDATRRHAQGDGKKPAASKPDARKPAATPSTNRPKKRVDKKTRAKPEAKVAADPRKLTLDRQLLDANGALSGDAEPTGLVWNAPMASLDLASAASFGDRVRALFYEWIGPGKTKGSTASAKVQVLGRARLSLASIDATGMFDDHRRASFRRAI